MLNARVSTPRQAGTASRRTRDLRLKDPSPLVAKRVFQLLLSALVNPRRFDGLQLISVTEEINISRGRICMVRRATAMARLDR